MSTTTVTATFSRPADATAYAAGDIIANSGTAASVVPLTFVLPGRTGRILGCSCVIAPASGNLVITACTFNLLLFRPATNIPFAAAGYPADNTAMAITAAAFREHIAKFSFVTGGWTNPAGTLTAGAVGYQDVAPAVSAVYPVFNLRGDSSAAVSSSLVGVVQAQAAWNPLGVVNQFDFVLDIDLD